MQLKYMIISNKKLLKLDRNQYLRWYSDQQCKLLDITRVDWVGFGENWWLEPG